MFYAKNRHKLEKKILMNQLKNIYIYEGSNKMI